MKRFAIVEDGVVANVILWDEEAELQLSENAVAVELKGGQDFAVGEQYDAAKPPPAPPALTHDELVLQAKAAIRVERQPIISILDGLQTSALVTGKTDLAMALETAKQGLRDLTDLDLSACVTYEDMRLAVKARYAQLAAALPASVRVAFSEAVS